MILTSSERLKLMSLPNEILVHALTPFPTQDLLPLAVICRRFHALIVRILHFRLLLAAELPDYKVILEAYHPSRKNTDPYLFCTYLGTDGLSSKHEGEGSLYADCVGEGGRLAKLGALYSRFRPESPGVEGSMPARRIAGAAMQPGGAAGGGTAGTPTIQPIYANGGDGGLKRVLHTMNLDADELFGQFCAYSSLVRLGPRRGVFLSTVHIVKTGQGVMRVWREWLQERAKEYKEREAQTGSGDLERYPLARSSTMACPNFDVDKSILWTDHKKNVGLRVVVKDMQRRFTAPSNSRYVDDLPFSFSLEIQELVVRTTHLMLAVEASMEEQEGQGKALIFGNFAMSGSRAVTSGS